MEVVLLPWVWTISGLIFFNPLNNYDPLFSKSGDGHFCNFYETESQCDIGAKYFGCLWCITKNAGNDQWTSLCAHKDYAVESPSNSKDWKNTVANKYMCAGGIGGIDSMASLK